jgi:dephospho-CoA kinase
MTKKVILVSGKLQSGKNTFTDILMEEMKKSISIDYDYFAKPLKNECKTVFSNLVDYLNKISLEHNIPSLYTNEDSWYENKNEVTRILLQTYGTDIFRELVDEDWWAKKLKKKILARDEEVIVVSDVRFKSELRIFEQDNDLKLIKIRIERDNYSRDNNPIHSHISELDLDDYSNWDFVLKNNETIDVLKQNTLILLDGINTIFSL